MAAHPFGPIENQLIVGYYKRGFDPTRVKPRFLTQNVQVPNSQHNPIHHILQPVFYGWSPANGNSSSHDFKVSQSFELLSDEELLSRGLGYRITFTMPSKQIVTNDPTTWPVNKIELLNYFGDRVLYENTFTMDYFEPEFVRYLTQFGCLQAEVTPLSLKITQDGTTEHIIHAYAQDSSELHLAYYHMVRTHCPYLVKAEPGGFRQDPAVFRSLLSSYQGALGTLNRHRETLTNQQRTLMKNHLHNCTFYIGQLMTHILHGESKDQVEKTGLDQYSFLTKMTKWLSMEGARFDKNIPAMAQSLNLILKPLKSIVIPKNRISNLADLGGFPKLRKLSTFRFSPRPLFEFFVDRVLLLPEAQINIKVAELPHLVSNNYLLRIESIQETVSVCQLSCRNTSDQPPREFLQDGSQFFIIPKTDLLVCLPVKKLRNQNFSVIDLQSSYHSESGNKFKSFDLPDLDLQNLNQIVLTAHVSKIGYSIVLRSVASIPKTRLIHLPWKIVWGKLVVGPKWAEFSLKTKETDFSFGSVDNNLHSAINHSHRTGQVFTAFWHPTYKVNSKILLQCNWYGVDSLMLKKSVVVSNARSPNKRTVVWIESHRSSTSNTYACVFTSDRLLSLWVYHKNNFSPIGLPKQPRPTKAESEAGRRRFFPCNRFETPVAVMRSRFCRKLPDGHDCYRVGRLYLKY